MYRLLSTVFALFILCTGCAQAGSDQLAIHTDDLTGDACQVTCNTCPPNQYCTQECTLHGQCKSSCTYVAICAQGYQWDNQVCRCLPTPEPQRQCNVIGLCMPGYEWDDVACTCKPTPNSGKTCDVYGLCVEGHHWDADVCGCLPDAAGGDTAAGESCGSNTCTGGQVCCNASCGICTDPGGFCIQLACEMN